MGDHPTSGEHPVMRGPSYNLAQLCDATSSLALSPSAPTVPTVPSARTCASCNGVVRDADALTLPGMHWCAACFDMGATATYIADQITSRPAGLMYGPMFVPHFCERNRAKLSDAQVTTFVYAVRAEVARRLGLDEVPDLEDFMAHGVVQYLDEHDVHRAQ